MMFGYCDTMYTIHDQKCINMNAFYQTQNTYNDKYI